MLATGDHFHRFENVIIGKQHAAQRTAHQLFATGRPLCHPVEQGPVVFEVVSVLLGEIAQIGTFGPLDGTGHGRQLVDQGTQQGSFADTVRPNDRHPLACFYLQTEILEQGLAIETLADFVKNDSLTVQLLVLIKANERTDPA